MVRPGLPFVPDLEHWEDDVVFPDIETWDWDGAAAEAAEMRNEGSIVKVVFFTGLFERLISFVGTTNALIGLVDEDAKPAIHRLFDRLCTLYDSIFAKFKRYFHAEVIWFHDDWGSQRAPFFSLDTVNEMITPYLKRCVESAHRYGMGVNDFRQTERGAGFRGVGHPPQSHLSEPLCSGPRHCTVCGR
jgi:hypothetical protein